MWVAEIADIEAFSVLGAVSRAAPGIGLGTGALLRECLSGGKVTFAGDHYQVPNLRLGVELGDRRPKIILGALGEGMLRLAGQEADGVLLNYLPASHVPWCVEQVGAAGTRRSTPTSTSASATRN